MIRVSLIKNRVVIIGATLLAMMFFIMTKPELSVIPNVEKTETVITEDFSSDKYVNTVSDTPPKSSLPSSLEGTSHGVTLTAHQDNLVVTARLKDLFDYYLSTSGEESFYQINQRVVHDLSSQLTALALAQALGIWENYVSYKKELVDLDKQYPTANNAFDKYQHLNILQQRQLSLIALQDQIFSKPVAQILFSFDRQLDHHTLEKARILASDLSAEAKQQSLINLDAQLPIEVTLSMNRNKQQKQLLEIDGTLGLTDTQRYNLRAEKVGEAAANRLQKLDAKRLLWKSRINDFSIQKQQLLEAELADEDYLLSLDKLYQQFFSPDELLRAKALTR